MLFCSRYSKSLDDAFASLRIQEQGVASDDAGPEASTVNKPAGQPDPSWDSGWHGTSNSNAVALPGIESSSEMAIILLALRKLREALLASGAMETMTEFCQRVYVFNVRVAVLAFHPSSYHPSLMYLLSSLHTTRHPLPTSELAEMTTYSILDLACRQEDLASAFALRARSCERFGYANTNLDRILASLVTNNWLLFWKVRRKVDGYVRAILYWKIPTVRKTALKMIARSYMTCDLDWIMLCATGHEMTWMELVKSENVGWIRENNDKITIRKPKSK